jgi:gliding motility-associated-like protein
VQSNIISSTAGAIAPVGCTGAANGIAVATASGGTPPYTFTWNTVPPQVNDTATGLTPGMYVVTIVDSLNCSTVDTVNIPNPTNLLVSVTPTQVSCSGDSSSIATAVVSGGIPPYSYSWSPYGGNTAVADSLVDGTYVVTVTDSAGCVQTGNITIASSSTIVITTDAATQPHCYGGNDGSIAITVTGGAGGYSYNWIPGGATTEDLTNIDAGVYNVTVTDANGCTGQQQVNLGQPPPVPAYAGSDTAICAGATIQLAATLQAGSTGTWSSQTVTTFSDIHDPNATVTNVPGGFNTITWTVVDANGCTGTDDVSVFNYNFSAGADVLQCNMNPIQLNATTGPGFNGLWTWTSGAISLNDPTLNNAIVTFADYAVDTLTWTVSNPACSSSDQVVVAAYQQPTAEAGDTQTVCIAEVVLDAYSPGIGTGMWSVRQPNPSQLIDSLDPHTRGINLPKGDTTVFVWTVTNEICVAADTVAIYYDESCELILPNGFSPNKDGLNDGYYIKSIEAYPENVFRVFNRWGNEVYKQDNYKNTDWTGQNNNNEDLPEGTYFVILEVKNSNIVKNTYVDLRRFTGN